MTYIKLFLLFSNMIFADTIPTGLDDSQANVLIDSFSSAYSSALSKHSYALGEKAAFSISSSYMDLSDLSKASSSSNSDYLFINYLNISKGLFYNFDLGLSSIVPVQSETTISGFGGHINWLKAYNNGIIFKPTVYLYNLNLDNVYNSFSSGVSLSIFKRFSIFTLGAHYIAESNEVDINDRKDNTNIFISGEKKNQERFYHSIGISTALELKKMDIIIQPVFRFDSNFTINMKLNFNI